jgi:glycosyltransferase involved in cell wall biosynthesis
VRSQTFKDWELLVVDDCSPDSSEKMVKGFNDPRIRYVRHSNNQGVSAARNTGIRNSSPSRFLAFIDDDDEWLPSKVALQLDVFRKGDDTLGAVGCGRIDYTDHRKETVLPNYRGWIFEHLLARRAKGFSSPLLLVKRSSSRQDILFDTDLPCLEDNDYVIRLSQHFSFDFVEEPLVKVYRDKLRQHVWNSENVIVGYSKLLEKYRSFLLERPTVMSYYNVCIARELLKLSRITEARNALQRAIKSCPKQTKLRIWFLSMLFGNIGLDICSRLFPIHPPFSVDE